LIFIYTGCQIDLPQKYIDIPRKRNPYTVILINVFLLIFFHFIIS
jgi:uncharacterized membrane protein (DUF485 family)